jgi:hypothetical protein
MGKGKKFWKWGGISFLGSINVIDVDLTSG